MAAILSEKEYSVVCVVNTISEKIRLESLELPVFEPGLHELISLGLDSGRITFETKSDVILTTNSVVILAHDTKVNEQDESDLSEFNADLDFVINAFSGNSQILISAQVPAGTYSKLIQKFSDIRPNLSEQISFLPENLRLGKALERFRNPPLPVIGCTEKNQKFWREFFLFTGVDFHFCSQSEAEFLKHSLNSYLAMNIAFGNEIHRMGDKFGANGKRIIELLELEPRVGKLSPKKPGLPFFGGTLARDLVTLRNFSIQGECLTPVIDSILDSNENQKSYVLNKILELDFIQRSSDLSICVLGLTYTAETSTLRRSPGLWLIEELASRNFHVSAYDPRVNKINSDFRLLTEDEMVKNKFDCFILVSPWLSLKNEVANYVTTEYFIDIEGHLFQNGVKLPPNYRQIF